MYKVITIGDKDIPMLAVASVNLFCKRVFGVDPLKSVGTDMDYTDGIDLYQKVGFIMAKLAECNKNGNFAPMNELNEDSYLMWLCEIDNGDYIEKTKDIAELYIGTNKPTGKPKNQ